MLRVVRQLLVRLSQTTNAFDKFFEDYISYFDSLWSSDMDAKQNHAQHSIPEISEAAAALKVELNKLTELKKSFEESVDLVGSLVLISSVRHSQDFSISIYITWFLFEDVIINASTDQMTYSSSYV